MAEQPKTQRCGNCRYWESEGAEENSDSHGEYFVGRCRRYPPQPDVGDRTYRIPGDWPCTPDDSWCGEYAPAAPETVDEGAATLARLVLLGDLTAARALADKLRE